MEAEVKKSGPDDTLSPPVRQKKRCENGIVENTLTV